MRSKLPLILAAVIAALLTGCDKAPATMPEVNDANCQIDTIKQIEDEATRREFGSLCSRRPVGPDTLPANPKKW
jgi:entry exclusion lipoprotein TrbK